MPQFASWESEKREGAQTEEPRSPAPTKHSDTPAEANDSAIDPALRNPDREAPADAAKDAARTQTQSPGVSMPLRPVEPANFIHRRYPDDSPQGAQQRVSSPAPPHTHSPSNPPPNSAPNGTNNSAPGTPPVRRSPPQAAAIPQQQQQPPPPFGAPAYGDRNGHHPADLTPHAGPHAHGPYIYAPPPPPPGFDRYDAPPPPGAPHHHQQHSPQVHHHAHAGHSGHPGQHSHVPNHSPYTAPGLPQFAPPPMHHAHHQPGAPPGVSPQYSYGGHVQSHVGPGGGHGPGAGGGGYGYQQGAPVTIMHTDDAATKLSDRVRRRCFNCCTTDTSTWRRSNLSPGKVLCNKCGLFERTHSRPRPEQFPHKRGPLASTSLGRRTPPSHSSSPNLSAVHGSVPSASMGSMGSMSHGPPGPYGAPNGGGSGNYTLAPIGATPTYGYTPQHSIPPLHSVNAPPPQQQQQQQDRRDSVGPANGNGLPGMQSWGAPPPPQQQQQQQQQQPQQQQQQQQDGGAGVGSAHGSPHLGANGGRRQDQQQQHGGSPAGQQGQGQQGQQVGPGGQRLPTPPPSLSRSGNSSAEGREEGRA